MPTSTSPRTRLMLCTPTSDKLHLVDLRRKRTASNMQLSDLSVPVRSQSEQHHLPFLNLQHDMHLVEWCITFEHVTLFPMILVYICTLVLTGDACFKLYLLNPLIFSVYFPLSEPELQYLGRIPLHSTVQSTKLLNAKGISSLTFFFSATLVASV